MYVPASDFSYMFCSCIKHWPTRILLLLWHRQFIKFTRALLQKCIHFGNITFIFNYWVIHIAKWIKYVCSGCKERRLNFMSILHHFSFSITNIPYSSLVLFFSFFLFFYSCFITATTLSCFFIGRMLFVLLFECSTTSYLHIVSKIWT